MTLLKVAIDMHLDVCPFVYQTRLPVEWSIRHFCRVNCNILR